jgi:uncharacterized protein (TIGR03083 family)
MLSRPEIESGYPTELQSFAELLRSLSPEEAATPSRCEGWSVADVGAHVAGGLTDVVNLNLDGAGTPEWTQRQVDERRGRTPAELADEIDGATKQAVDLMAAFDDAAWNGPIPAGGLPGTIGTGIEGLFYDVFLHGDDIRAATGRPSAGGPGLRVSVHHVAGLLTDRGYRGVTLRLDGIDEVDVSGGGEKITGDPLQFVLAATGRRDPAPLGLGADINVYAD